MEFVGQPGLSGACCLLEVPGLSPPDVDSDEGEVVIGIRPKSSPLPRRRSSVTDEDSEPEPPLCGSRRVSFADAKGLSLVQVKEFVTWDLPQPLGYDSCEVEGRELDEYYLSPLTFSLPLPNEEMLIKVRDQKVELETIELLPGTTVLRGVIRVLNISFSKAVYVRTSFDTWSSHFDLLAEYIPGSSDGLMDCFSFKLTLVPPFGQQGARVDFCVRYETPVGTFWANNNNRNYVLDIHHRKDKPQADIVNKKSCLKTVSQSSSPVENISPMEASSEENISADESKHGEEVNNIKGEKISEGQSEEGGQTFPSENGLISQRRARKAARMARVRDYLSQRNREESDTERDESPPEAKQGARREKPMDKLSHVQSFLEESSKPEPSCTFPVDVLHDASQANLNTPNNEPEKSESNNLADVATLAGGDSATDIPDNLMRPNDELAPAERQNINNPVPRAEGESQTQPTPYEAAPADSVVSVMTSQSPVGQSDSFTFGTVMAPLYHQMFGRVGSESQSVCDRGSPVWAALNTGDLTQSSNSKLLNPEVHPHSGIPIQSLHLQGEAQEDKCSETESQESQLDTLFLHSPSATEQFANETHRQTSSGGKNDYMCVNELNTQADNGKNITESTTGSFPEVNVDTNQIPHSATEEAANISAFRGEMTHGNYFSTQEAQSETSNVEEQNMMTDSSYKDESEISTETKNSHEATEPIIKAKVNNNQMHDDGTFVMSKDENTLKDEPIPAVLKKGSFDLADIADRKNWEMLEEEENNRATDQEEIEAISSKADQREDVEERGESLQLLTDGENRAETENDVGLEEDIWEVMAEKEGGSVWKEIHFVQTTMTETATGEEEDAEEVEESDKSCKKSEVTDGRTGFQEVDESERDEDMAMYLNDRDGAGVVWGEYEENSNYASDSEGVDADTEDMTIEDGDDEVGCFEERSDHIQNKVQVSSSAPMYSVQNKRGTDRDREDGEGGNAHVSTETDVHTEDAIQSSEHVARERSKAVEGDSCSITDEPESDQTSHGGASTESDSDDEVELYMHCLRAVHTGTQASKDRHKDTGFSVCRRSSVNRRKPLPMPPIRESLDEEPHLSCLQDNHDDTDVAEFVAASLSGGQEPNNRSVSRWKETFSCSNISKTLLCTALVVVFLVVAYHYDFLACFGLYLMSVVWLCCQRERQPVKKDSRIG